MPTRLAGGPGNEPAHLALQPGPAGTTGSFSGIDGNSPHGVLPHTVLWARRPPNGRKSKAGSETTVFVAHLVTPRRARDSESLAVVSLRAHQQPRRWQPRRWQPRRAQSFERRRATGQVEHGPIGAHHPPPRRVRRWIVEGLDGAGGAPHPKVLSSTHWTARGSQVWPPSTSRQPPRPLLGVFGPTSTASDGRCGVCGRARAVRESPRALLRRQNRLRRLPPRRPALLPLGAQSRFLMPRSGR